MKHKTTTEAKVPAPKAPVKTDDIIAIPGDSEQSIYRFIVVAAKRARQLQSGQRPKVQVGARKLTRVAIEETRKGLVPFMDPETAPPPEPAEPEESQDEE